MSYKIKRALPFLGLCISILVITACITHKSEPFGTVIILNGPSAVGKPIIITEGHIHAFIGSLLGVCIFPVLRIWYDSLKSK
ncbi:MAG TPA: hypothetical protein VKR58_04980 [Aquella sp.]|jgi:hypothetical protein|nr:hypothetical protein [Aquella sp.]